MKIECTGGNKEFYFLHGKKVDKVFFLMSGLAAVIYLTFGTAKFQKNYVLEIFYFGLAMRLDHRTYT